MTSFERTIISDRNIHNLVEIYKINKNRLPNDLRNIPIGDWDVSNVTDMSSLFFDDEMFNEPLDNWDVSNVTNMRSMFMNCINFEQSLNEWKVNNVTSMANMFEECEKFNQPLNKWNVSKVTDMEQMFMGCRNFNQPLNEWNVSNVTNIAYIFEGCPIEEQNKPQFLVEDTAYTNYDGDDYDDYEDDYQYDDNEEVDPYQIHTESAKVNYEKLIDFFNEKLISSSITIPENINYPSYINDSLLKMINESDESETDKNSQINGLNRIMNERLNNVNYSEFSPLLLKTIFYTLQYVLTQPPEFQKIYVNTFIQECVYAHSGPDGMTCPAGALERIVNSLVNPCQTMLTTNENEDYEKIIAIIIANPNKMIPEYIRDWYKLHKTGTPEAFPPNTTVAEKKASLKNFLLEKFPEEGKLIDYKITEIADNIGYDDDDFMYGGRKRKFKKSTNTRRRTNTRKRTNTRRRTNTRKRTNTKKARKVRKIKIQSKKAKKVIQVIKSKKQEKTRKNKK